MLLACTIGPAWRVPVAGGHMVESRSYDLRSELPVGRSDWRKRVPMVDGTQKAAPESRLRTGLAAGLAGFAGVLLLVVGAFQALQGLSAIVRDWLLVLTQDYIYRFDSTAWGWIHLLIGLSLAAVGAAILAGKVWGRVVG